MSYNKYKLTREIVKKYMSIIMMLTTGEGTVDKALLKKLKIPAELRDLLTKSFKYGKSRISMGDVVKKLDSKELQTALDRMKLSNNQKATIEFSKVQTGNYITGLENKINSTIASSLAGNNLATIRSVITEGLSESSSLYGVVSELREKTEDWNRDWYRVAQTEMWNAKVQGEVQAILDNESPFTSEGSESLVFKRPAWNACPHCVKHYLVPGTQKPRVFKLSEILQNGTNYNRKTGEWKPVVGVMHPNCLCTLSVMPKGFTFDEDGDLIPEEK